MYKPWQAHLSWCLWDVSWHTRDISRVSTGCVTISKPRIAGTIFSPATTAAPHKPCTQTIVSKLHACSSLCCPIESCHPLALSILHLCDETKVEVQNLQTLILPFKIFGSVSTRPYINLVIFAHKSEPHFQSASSHCQRGKPVPKPERFHKGRFTQGVKAVKSWDQLNQYLSYFEAQTNLK